MMKKLFTLCLACMLCLTLGGCQKANDSDKGKQEKITDATQLLRKMKSFRFLAAM